MAQPLSPLWRRRHWCATIGGLAAATATGLAGCAATPQHRDAEVVSEPHPNRHDAAQLQRADAVLLGEQHDAQEHHALETACTQWLIAQGRLGALVLEMADAGQDTRGLPIQASVRDVQRHLRWSEGAWPWSDYANAIMAAVRAGVPVFGGNLPVSEMAQAMKNEALSAQVPRTAWQALTAAVADGHCGLLPAGQIAPMARIQIAKDQSMAHTLKRAHVATQTSLLLCGSAHANRQQGVPLHLPATWRVLSVHLRALDTPIAAPGAFDMEWLTPATPPRDYCAELKAQWAIPKPKP